ncbi:hypothetical protein TRFO_18316 [Tritrichomonas foetus]|uniref:Uncharacterized protein n=1 Tax=Tritrichomonas foetus TaxID=1144522 RepID=A0A1J4KQS4_9EUKA|nr:hypothetical protein TRFO_18316 [Tritrichomonas foetus]|eukprot:OHT12022.1 hypothetical protein TRFO_18316 [Tritrichomonas foetus]
MSIIAFGAGLNDSHQLGNKSNSEANGNPTVVTPVKFDNIDGKSIRCVSAGSDQTLFVMNDGRVFALGNDSRFHIGSEKRIEYSYPTEVRISKERITWAACGRSYSIYLTSSGRVIYCSEKSIGNRAIITHSVPAVYVCGGMSFPCSIDRDGAFYVFDEDPSREPKRYQLEKPVFDIASGIGFVLALTLDGVVYGNGQLNNYQDSFVPIISLSTVNVTRVFAFGQHAAVLTDSGKLRTWGNNVCGQLGMGTTEKNHTFSKVTTLKDVPLSLIACGREHTVFVTDDGRLMGCGANNCGQLMFGHNEPKVLTPEVSPEFNEHVAFIAAGCYHTVLVTGDVPLKHPGADAFGLYCSPIEEEEEEEEIDELTMLRRENQALKDKLAIMEQENGDLMARVKMLESKLRAVRKALKT